MRILVTGASGFIAKNLLAHLNEHKQYQSLTFTRGESVKALEDKVAQCDFIVHLAGVNRPADDSEFAVANAGLTSQLCKAVQLAGRRIPIIYTSSIQAEMDNLYGRSKFQGEEFLRQFSIQASNPVYMYRLPNVFGKWCRPNYNSVVATFCNNIVEDIPINIHDPDAVLNLVYIDDLIKDFLQVIETRPSDGYRKLNQTYQISVGGLAAQLSQFKSSRSSLLTEPVGTGLVRALYATYISCFKPGQFVYPLVKKEDARGAFVEVLKTKDSGQFSFFTAHPGVTRGGHYHHTKSEKFIVVKGTARFGFRHIVTGEVAEIFTSSQQPQVVETIPGWAHDITNIGQDEMIVMLWANEIFDQSQPDTKSHQVFT